MNSNIRSLNQIFIRLSLSDDCGFALVYEDFSGSWIGDVLIGHGEAVGAYIENCKEVSRSGSGKLP